VGGRVDERLPALHDERVQLIRIAGGSGEPAILRGARGLLEASRPALVFDWCADSWSALGEHPAATAELLAGLDYTVFTPVLRREAAWSVRPPAFERFEPASLDALAARTGPGSYVVALPATAARAASQLTRPR
jgi:hypothetical protein